MKLLCSIILIFISAQLYSQEEDTTSGKSPFRYVSFVSGVASSIQGLPVWKNSICYQQKFKSSPIVWHVSLNFPKFYKTLSYSDITAKPEQVSDTSFGLVNYERAAYNDVDFRVGLGKLIYVSSKIQILTGAECIMGRIQIEIKETHQWFLLDGNGGIGNDKPSSADLYATKTEEYHTIGTYLKRGIAPYLTMQYSLNDNVKISSELKVDFHGWKQINEKSPSAAHISTQFPPKFNNSSVFMIELGIGYSF